MKKYDFKSVLHLGAPEGLSWLSTQLDLGSGLDLRIVGPGCTMGSTLGVEPAFKKMYFIFILIF